MSTLDLRIKRPIRAVDPSEWSEWTSEGKVIGDMLKTSGLQDKTVAIEISVDPAVLSKAQTGQARLAEGALDALMDACGSEAWLHYWLVKRGYDPRALRKLETETERRARIAEERAAKAEEKVRLLTEVISGRTQHVAEIA